MTRDLTAGMQTAVAAQRAEYTHLFQIATSGGTTRIAAAPFDIAWDSETWVGVGGTVQYDAVAEATDMSEQAVLITLSGVNQTMVSVFLNNNFRGRVIRIWRAHVAADGTVVDAPIELFHGVQLGDVRVREAATGNDAATCDVELQVVSELSLLENAVTVHTNVHSHNDMLKRAGLATGDTFFQHTPRLGRAGVVTWGPFVVSGGRATGTKAKRRGT